MERELESSLPHLENWANSEGTTLSLTPIQFKYAVYYALPRLLILTIHHARHIVHHARHVLHHRLATGAYHLVALLCRLVSCVLWLICCWVSFAEFVELGAVVGVTVWVGCLPALD